MLVDPGLLDKEAEQKAQTRLKMVRSVSSVMNTDTLGHLEQIGSALTAIAGEGDGIDNEGMVSLCYIIFFIRAVLIFATFDY